MWREWNKLQMQSRGLEHASLQGDCRKGYNEFLSALQVALILLAPAPLTQGLGARRRSRKLIQKNAEGL
jgi:hypothetical protein